MHACFLQLSNLWAAAVAVTSHFVHAVFVLAGLSRLIPDATGFAECLLIGIAQMFVIGVVFLPLEMFAPAEVWQDRRYARVDVVHTVINQLGIIPFGTYLLLIPISDAVFRMVGHDPSGSDWHLGHMIPWLNQHPLALFMVYFVILDFAAWLMHRLQHGLGWWWALHSLHHSQRQMNRWTDDRGSVIDHILQATFIAVCGLIIGVAPVEYGLIVFLGTMVEKLSHANTRLGFGPLLDKLFVDPRFHRQHHMVASVAQPELHNCNFGFVFPIWDIIFGTALYDGVLRATGINDPEIDADNFKGWWGQQVASTQRMVRALQPRPKTSELANNESRHIDIDEPVLAQTTA